MKDGCQLSSRKYKLKKKELMLLVRTRGSILNSKETYNEKIKNINYYYNNNLYYKENKMI